MVYVCAGTWDANFINCNALPGQSGVGQVTITATSGTITATAAAYSHLQADQVFVNPIKNCVSINATPTYTATVYSTTAQGCSAVSPCDITSTVGPITFTSTDLLVMANNATTGVLTATAPGCHWHLRHRLRTEQRTSAGIGMPGSVDSGPRRRQFGNLIHPCSGGGRKP